MSIDNGQFEAGRSLGFNYVQTMVHIIMPQAFKNRTSGTWKRVYRIVERDVGIRLYCASGSDKGRILSEAVLMMHLCR